ncbi:MAG TPA: protein phosphatase 2C domain-containing protein [Kofleriaceae bacterium]|nr:protein phosphatase 2C domain-containing protein [Kofleriaceae bacterium]
MRVVELSAFGKSDVGQVRDGNEDAFAIGDLDRGELWDGLEVAHAGGERGLVMVVCDGMGGASAGEVASELAARTVWREMREARHTSEPEVFARVLRRAVRVANRRVFDEAQREATLRGMGTTVTCAGVVGTKLVIAQVGDSRVYVLREGVLVQVTRDQSLVSALVNAGQLHPTEASGYPASSAILQALGVGPDVEPSLSWVDLRRGDRVLLCSDGLHGQLGDSALSVILHDAKSPQQAAESLVAAARAAGGNDNITAVCAEITGALDKPASEEDLPKFVEFDPREEGERALHSTSFVVRRLAARVGIGEDPGDPVVPATGTHMIVPRRRNTPPTSIADVAGPARARLGGQGLLRRLWWVPMIVVAAAIGWYLAR